MSARRDMTEAQFLAALRKHGMAQVGFGGYITVHRSFRPDGSQRSSLQVCRHNAGPKLRAQLAFLLREQERAEDEERARLEGKE